MRRLLVGLFFCVGLIFVVGTGCTSDPGANDPKISDKAPPPVKQLDPSTGGDKKGSGPKSAKPE
jgi:hypothetical protein